jgi:hypothetical protein
VKTLLAAGFVGLLLVSVSGASGARSGSPEQIAPFVHTAIILEQDAQRHRTTDRAAAQQELSSSLTALQHALVLAPPAAATSSLKQAATKDEDALSLLGTPNPAKVRLDLATALNLKEKALTDMRLKPVGTATTSLPPLPPEPLKPPPSTATPPSLNTPVPPTGKPQNPQQAAIELVSEAITHENDAAQALDRGETYAQVDSLLGNSVDDLEHAFTITSSTKGLGKASLQIWYALDHDYEAFDILDWKVDGCADCELENGYDHKLKALEDLGLTVGHSTVAITDLTSVFDPKHLATDYTVAASSSAPGATLDYEWSLGLRLVDRPGSPAPGIPGSGAAIDLSCNNSYLPGGTVLLHPAALVQLLAGFLAPVTIVWTNQDSTFTWYHGDVGSYAGSPYGCQHQKMGPSSHQGVVAVTVSDGIWQCTSFIDGSNLGLVPVHGVSPRCYFLPG